MVEAVFKGAGRALKEALSIDERSSGVPSTKGIL
jgi:imidazoleglycerol-phosphate dehydratase